MFKRLIFAALMLLSSPVWAQHGGTAQQFTVNDIEGNTIYIGTITSNTPFVQFNSTTSGILLPELTTTQMDAIGSPQIGELLYNTSNSEFMFYTGSQWSNVATPTTSGTALLAGNGSGGILNVTIGTGLSYNTSSQTLSTTSGSWVPNNIQVFTTSGTWTQPAGLTKVFVKVIGGGGGGYGGTGSTSAGGGSGAYAEGIIAVTGNVTVTVGAAGTGGGTATGGGTSSFAGSTTIQATGGGAASSDTPGTGGSATGGTINISGFAGNTLYTGSGSGGGNSGANTPLGWGQGGYYGVVNGQVFNAQGYGSGGAGIVQAASGGNGTGGIVIVYY